MAMNTKTPREYSAGRRGLPFGSYRRGDEEIRWDICQGRVCVTRGKNHYVVPLLCYGVVDDDTKESGYSIAVYWHINEDMPWMHRIYALSTMRRFAFRNDLQELERGLTYSDMIERVHKEYPGLPVPTIEQFYGQYGLFAGQVEEVDDNA